MGYFPVFLLAFAVSMDSFSVGFTYGLRKMALPLKSALIIACCSALSMFTSVAAGKLASAWLPSWMANMAGGTILILLGAWVLYQFFRPSRDSQTENKERTIVNYEVRSLGLVIKILKKPLSADFDLSGTITGIEAILLGLALSLDSFGAGFGAAMLDLPPVVLSIAAAVMSSVFVYAGIKCGTFFSRWRWIEKIAFFPGMLLIVIGIWKL
ncbi:sporulation membrane protein YtaF [Neobacillus notoginsengisoli]|uniref:Sporulation membrane protein YtaF n=1 Tax=Neobacillus notoginsengisoli TaxID=1578198 RepID=A0A417YU63_9BACI|nr:sporulation membrane protein YtaF [Neobacillus notoginsengisoli]RHW40713.1 sporulation membrane protein YtaF [Neobacillus notoginsengisoli]